MDQQLDSRYALGPEEVKGMGTMQLRNNFLIEKIFEAGKVHLAQMLITREQMLAPMTSQRHAPLIYYSGAAWDKAGEITSSEQWFNYLRLYKQKLEQPLKIIVRKA